MDFAVLRFVAGWRLYTSRYNSIATDKVVGNSDCEPNLPHVFCLLILIIDGYRLYFFKKLRRVNERTEIAACANYKTDRNGCQKSLGHVGDDYSDKKYDGVEPEIVENEGDYEEGDTEEDGDSSDNVDEVCDLTSYRRLDRLQSASQDRDPTHHRPIARVDHHTAARTYRTTKSLEK